MKAGNTHCCSVFDLKEGKGQVCGAHLDILCPGPGLWREGWPHPAELMKANNFLLLGDARPEKPNAA